MTMVPQRLSLTGGLQAVAQAACTVAHSLRVRGVRNTLAFAGLGTALPTAAEYQAINVTAILRHRTEPKFAGVPLIAFLGWYNVNYAVFSVVEGVAVESGLSASTRRWIVPVGTALVATSLDLMLDCVGLEQALWEWQTDGPYAADITGPNGRHGIPLLNFAAWLGLAGTVTGLYQALAGGTAPSTPHRWEPGSVEATRAAGVLLLPYYLVGASWAIQRRKPRYLLYSALVPLVLSRVPWRGRRSPRP